MIGQLLTDLITKICTKCGNNLPATADHFHLDSQKKDGLRPDCKKCVNGRRKNPYVRDRLKKYMKEWHKKNDSTEYNKRPENIARKAAWSKEYHKKKYKPRPIQRKTPEEISAREKEYSKKYWQRPDVKERDNARRRLKYATDQEYREKRKIYGSEHRKRAYVKKRISELKRERMVNDPRYRLNNAISCSVGRCLLGRKNGPTFGILNFTKEDLIKHLESNFSEGMSWDNYGKNGWEVDHIIPVAAHNFEKPEDEDFKRCWSLSNLQPMWASENSSKGANLDKPFQQSLVFSWGDADGV